MKKKKSKILIIVLGMVFILAAALLAFPLLISVNGEKEMTVGQGEVFEDPGASVRFNLGKVKTEGKVNTSQLGDYTITYRFLTEKAERTVHVVDILRPSIELKGSLNKYLLVGEEYVEPGFSAFDDNDGDLTDKVTIENNLDINKAGEYHISYIVSDMAGNASRERRTVTVVSEGPLTMDRFSFDLDPFYDDVICRENSYVDEGDYPASHTYDDVKFGELLFFGDSFIGNLGDYGVVSYDQLWSRGSLGTDSVYDAPITVYGYYDGYSTFFDAMDAYHPKTVLVLLNSDRTLHWTPEYLEESCDAFYKEIKDRYTDTKFIICSITPVDEYYSSEAWQWQEGFDRNDRINKMNAYICELCRKYGFKFMNAAQVLKNPETGCCANEYIGEDGIHLNYEGYSLMVDYIKHHMDW